MIVLKNIELRRGQQRLLHDASVRIDGQRAVGLIGQNGCGKSSLFQLLLGVLQPDAGDVVIPSSLQVSHMQQDIFTPRRLALDYVLDGDVKLRQLEQQLQQAEQSDDDSALARLYAELEQAGGFTARNRGEQLLQGLGFSRQQMAQAAGSFSGGWRIRLNLAQALMTPSQLLLLDEPTNHLDIDATLWLEQWLKVYSGTLVLVSHDRDFLDNVVDEIIHIEHEQLNHYRGNYSQFERQRAEKLAQQQANYQRQQQRIAEIEQFVARFKAKASKAKQAQSRVKELARMEQIAPAHVDSPFQFTFFEQSKVSSPLITLRQAEVGYGQTAVLKQVSLSLEPGQRVGLLGVNGAGKSTLVKALVGDLPLLSGEREVGDHLRIGYFAQHQIEALDLDASALSHIQRLSPKISEPKIRAFLGGFNFHGDKAVEPVRPFSGGEKARLALAIIVWQRPNLLLLDEPTNHLDLEMRQALTMALQGYQGALVVISHDRHLLRNSVDQFYRLHDGIVEEFDEDLASYQQWLQQQRVVKEVPDPEAQSVKTIDKKSQRQLAAQLRKQLAPVSKKINQLEKKLEAAQAQLADAETKLTENNLYEADNKTQLAEVLQQQAQAQQQIEQLEEDWLHQQEQLEVLEARLMGEAGQ